MAVSVTKVGPELVSGLIGGAAACLLGYRVGDPSPCRGVSGVTSGANPQQM